MHKRLKISFRFNVHDSLRQRGQCEVGGLLFLQGRVEESCGVRQAQFGSPRLQRAVAGDLVVFNGLSGRGQARISAGMPLYSVMISAPSLVMPMIASHFFAWIFLPKILKTCSRRLTWPRVSLSCLTKAALSSLDCAALAIFGRVVRIFFSAK